jgi:hypothetical protein
MTLAVVAVTLATFAGPWWGHDRGITVTRDGRVSETVLDSCCHRDVALRLRLSNPRGTAKLARATATVAAVHVYDRSFYKDMHLPVPHVGDRATVRMQHGMLFEPFSGASYCRPNVGRCGA